jgi:hypothetical protein
VGKRSAAHISHHGYSKSRTKIAESSSSQALAGGLRYWLLRAPPPPSRARAFQKGDQRARRRHQAASTNNRRRRAKIHRRQCGSQQIRPTGRPRMADAIQDEQAGCSLHDSRKAVRESAAAAVSEAEQRRPIQGRLLSKGNAQVQRRPRPR